MINNIATQIFKGPREAYCLKEIYDDSFHKPVFANKKKKKSHLNCPSLDLCIQKQHANPNTEITVTLSSFVTYYFMGKQVTVTSNGMFEITR